LHISFFLFFRHHHFSIDFLETQTAGKRVAVCKTKKKSDKMATPSPSILVMDTNQGAKGGKGAEASLPLSLISGWLHGFVRESPWFLYDPVTDEDVLAATEAWWKRYGQPQWDAWCAWRHKCNKSIDEDDAWVTPLARAYMKQRARDYHGPMQSSSLSLLTLFPRFARAVLDEINVHSASIVEWIAIVSMETDTTQPFSVGTLRRSSSAPDNFDFFPRPAADAVVSEPIRIASSAIHYVRAADAASVDTNGMQRRRETWAAVYQLCQSRTMSADASTTASVASAAWEDFRHRLRDEIRSMRRPDNAQPSLATNGQSPSNGPSVKLTFADVYAAPSLHTFRAIAALSDDDALLPPVYTIDKHRPPRTLTQLTHMICTHIRDSDRAATDAAMLLLHTLMAKIGTNDASGAKDSSSAVWMGPLLHTDKAMKHLMESSSMHWKIESRIPTERIKDICQWNDWTAWLQVRQTALQRAVSWTHFVADRRGLQPQDASSASASTSPHLDLWSTVGFYERCSLTSNTGAAVPLWIYHTATLWKYTPDAPFLWIMRDEGAKPPHTPSHVQLSDTSSATDTMVEITHRVPAQDVCCATGEAMRLDLLLVSQVARVCPAQGSFQSVKAASDAHRAWQRFQRGNDAQDKGLVERMGGPPIADRLRHMQSLVPRVSHTRLADEQIQDASRCLLALQQEASQLAPHDTALQNWMIAFAMR
jgi:hypothetical protein